MGYLSLYKTLSEHSADNSRLTPNISLITDENKLILTTKNNLNMTFNNINVVETADDIINILINRFPTGTSTGMPCLKIYGDNTDQSKAKNIKIFNDVQQWRSNYIQNNGLSDTSQKIKMNVDALMIDNIIMDKYDGNYRYYIDIYKNDFYLYLNDVYIAKVYRDGSFDFSYDYNNIIFPSPTETRMPFLWIYNNSSGSNLYNLYNNARQWRKDYISYKGLSDTGQPISMFVDQLYIDEACMDVYNNSYNYHIDIYNDHIILLNNNSEEVLFISSDGSFAIRDNIFNKFPFPTGTSSNMPGLKIYTGDQSYNIEIYNDAQQYRKDYISYNEWSDIEQPIKIFVDALIIGSKVMDEYDNNYNYLIDIYNDRIILLNNYEYSEVLTISSDGSLENYTPPTLETTTPAPATPTPATPTPTPTPAPATPTPATPIPTTPTPDGDTTPNMSSIKIYTNNTEKSKQNNIKLYNDAQEWRNNSGHDRFQISGDALLIDDNTISQYDQRYQYYIFIYNDHIILLSSVEEILTILSDGSVQFSFNKFPSSTSTDMPSIKIYTDNSDQSKANNIELYNNAQEWRDNYMMYHGLGDTSQGIEMLVNQLVIDDETIDKYDWYYQYRIDIYNDHILLKNSSGLEILTISSDGSVQFLFNKFPSNTSSHMPSIKIYTDNSDQSKANNIELYNNAQEWRDNYIIYNGLSDTGQGIDIDFDQLVIDDKTIDKYDGNHKYYMDIYNDHIILLNNYIEEILTISGDGSVRQINPIPN